MHIFKMTQISLLLFFALEEVTISLYYAYTPQFLLFFRRQIIMLSVLSAILLLAIELSAGAAAAA